VTDSAQPDFDQQLKAADPDRWLSSRYVDDSAARFDLVALYLVDHEVAAVADKANGPLMGEIRLTWWREAVEAAAAGQGGRSHPALDALAPSLQAGRVDPALVLAMIDARYDELGDPWFEDESALDQWLEGAWSSIAVAAARRLDDSATAEQVSAAARAFGLGRLLMRPVPADAAPRWLPPIWSEVSGDEFSSHVSNKLAGLLAEARRTAPLSPRAFPAIAHASLVSRPQAGPLGRRFHLTAAVLKGRV
jgi:phytoene synthase